MAVCLLKGTIKQSMRRHKFHFAPLSESEITVKIQRGQVMRKMEADLLADLVRTVERLGPSTYDDAKRDIHHSLERMGVERVDLIQFHSLADPIEWDIALSPKGASRD